MITAAIKKLEPGDRFTFTWKGRTRTGTFIKPVASSKDMKYQLATVRFDGTKSTCYLYLEDLIKII